MPRKKTHTITSSEQPSKNWMDRPTNTMPKILPTRLISEVDHHNRPPSASRGSSAGQPGRASPDHHDITPHG
jgi:hypothetical protein